MKRWRAWALMALITLLSACVDTGVPLETVVAQGNEYMAAYQAWDKEKMASFYSPRMFTRMPEEAWWEMLEEKRRQLGALKSYSLMGKSKDTRFSGIFYILQYKTVYEHGDAREVITFIEPVDEDSLKIFAHSIQIRRLRQTSD